MSKIVKIISLISLAIMLAGCCDSLPPLKEPLYLGDFLYISDFTSSSKAWTYLAKDVAKEISKRFKKYPLMKSKKIYIIPGKDTVFEKNYREMLQAALTKNNFIVSENPECELIIKYTSHVVPNSKEVIVNTTLFDKGIIIFKNSSIFYIKDNSIHDYMIKVNAEQKHKLYQIVDH